MACGALLHPWRRVANGRWLVGGMAFDRGEYLPHQQLNPPHTCPGGSTRGHRGFLVLAFAFRTWWVAVFAGVAWYISNILITAVHQYVLDGYTVLAGHQCWDHHADVDTDPL